MIALRTGDLAVFAPATTSPLTARAAGLVVVDTVAPSLAACRVTNIASGHQAIALDGELAPVTVEPSAFMHDALTVTTPVLCSACGETITAVVSRHDVYTECGGEGEGGCDDWCEDGETSRTSHHIVADQARQVAEYYLRTR